jgi:hypothetical protein
MRGERSFRSLAFAGLAQYRSEGPAPTCPLVDFVRRSSVDGNKAAHSRQHDTDPGRLFVYDRTSRTTTQRDTARTAPTRKCPSRQRAALLIPPPTVPISAAYLTLSRREAARPASLAGHRCYPHGARAGARHEWGSPRPDCAGPVSLRSSAMRVASAQLSRTRTRLCAIRARSPARNPAVGSWRSSLTSVSRSQYYYDCGVWGPRWLASEWHRPNPRARSGDRPAGPPIGRLTPRCQSKAPPNPDLFRRPLGCDPLLR